jgi:hypothetical protein
MFEAKGEKLIPFHRFLGRVGLAFLIAFCIVGVALLMGVLGYHFIARLGWIDAVLNAAMILTGMGPVDPMKDNAAKLFASGYALFSGVVFLTSISLVLAPVFHRVIHHFHLEGSNPPAKPKAETRAPPRPRAGEE